jgi:hypothetical protein
MTSNSIFTSVAIGGAFTLAACGGADAPPPKAPSEAPQDVVAEPRTVQEAQDRIARARDELEATTPTADAKAAPADAPAAPPPTSAAPPSASSVAESVHDTCGGQCRALDSMRRAVEALCRMTGDGDSRCSLARKTLSASMSRLSPCKCEAR